MLLIALLLIGLWILIGLGLFLLAGRAPARGADAALVRRVDRRLCLVGERIRVTLECSAHGLPRPAAGAVLSPWDVVLVIDHSASMGAGTGSALDEACKAATNLVVTSPPGFRFAVVEFDHEAREICPFTDRQAGLSRAIQDIVRGGATDIALGLRVAGQSLERAGEAAPPRRRAVLLLSDGGSPAAAAIAAADALKTDPQLLLVTVGIGAADMPLLRRISDTPDHCFQAERIEELVALYSEIGRMVTGRDATEAVVEEHFSAAGFWGLRGWGELQPSAFSAPEGRCSWLLPVLGETPAALAYTVEALCPGWQPIAPRPAELRAKTAPDHEVRMASNQGPRVLVLPRVLGWQVLWLILNPLFFLLFGKRLCREQAAVVRPQPVAPAPAPLALPPLLPAAPAADPPLSIRPTLILGLGYAGMHSLVHAKRLIWEEAERVAWERLRFLVIDTADATFLPDLQAGLVGLAPAERLTLDRPLEPLIAAQAAGSAAGHPWLEAARLCAGGVRPDLHRGTGRERALGRLAVIENRAALEARLTPLLEALIAQSDARGIDLLVTAGSGGGTGSGGLLELCWLLRRLLEGRGEGSSSILFLSAPHAAQRLPGLPEERAMARANHRALLAELDRFATLRGEPLAPSLGLTPLNRWFDRVLCVGPADAAEWPAEEVLYPKTGEAILAWLASDAPGGLRDHFVQQDAVNAEQMARLGRCLLYRLDPVSHSLYPRTLQNYLVVDTLRRILASRLWDLDDAEFSGYGADSHTPGGTAALLGTWLRTRPAGTDYPWVLSALTALQDPDRLRQSLACGAGPEVSRAVSPLARGAFFDEQRQLVRAALDTWVLDTLNRGRDGLCGAHALGLCIHALGALLLRLREGAAVAGHLGAHSPLPVVRHEAATVAELATHAASETETVRRALADWDRCLGEGVQGRGLLRLLEVRTGRLRREVERLRAEAGAAVARSPSLPLSWEQIAALPARFLPDLGERLSARLGWSLERSGMQVVFSLHTQGRAARRWLAADPGQGGETGGCTEELAVELTTLGADLAPGFAAWQLADYPPETVPELRPGRPRTDGLNPGARGLYLVQGEPRFAGAAHMPRILIEPFDRREARVIGIEEHLASDRLWPDTRGAERLPFVFAEERNADRGYDTYCRAERREPAPLAPTLAGICRDPEALLAFALAGLAGGRISARDDGLHRIWWVEGRGGGRIDLAAADERPLAALLRVANAWIANPDPVLRRYEPARDERPQDLSGRIARHALAAPLVADPWYEQFVAVVWGLQQWY